MWPTPARAHVSFIRAAATVTHRLELRRGTALSLHELDRNVLLAYAVWELINLFLGGVLSASLTRHAAVWGVHAQQHRDIQNKHT